jgi:hypothetical protein
VSPFPVGKGVHAEVDKGGELKALPGDLPFQGAYFYQFAYIHTVLLFYAGIQLSELNSGVFQHNTVPVLFARGFNTQEPAYAGEPWGGSIIVTHTMIW